MNCFRGLYMFSKLFVYLFGLLALMLLSPKQAYSYELEFSRTYNKVLHDNNQLNMKLNSDGSVHLNYPEFHKNVRTLNFQVSAQKTSLIDQLIDQIDPKVSASVLKNKLNVVKRIHNPPLFYSSDVDLITLKVSNNGAVLWSLSLDNFAELEKHYEWMGQWQPLLDLIIEIQSWSNQNSILQIQGAD